MESVIDSIMPTLKASNISPILIKENIEDSNTLFNGLHDLQAGKTSFFDELNRKKAEGLKLARMEIRNNHPFDVPNFAENCAYKYIEALTFVRNMGNIDTRPIGKICGAMLSTMKTMFGELVELEHADELEGKKGSAVYTESLRRVKKDILEGVARDNGFDPALAREAQLGG